MDARSAGDDWDTMDCRVDSRYVPLILLTEEIPTARYPEREADGSVPHLQVFPQNSAELI